MRFYYSNYGAKPNITYVYIYVKIILFHRKYTHYMYIHIYMRLHKYKNIYDKMENTCTPYIRLIKDIYSLL
jgi:hypothetical protein